MHCILIAEDIWYKFPQCTWPDLETLTYAAVPLLQMWPDLTYIYDRTWPRNTHPCNHSTASDMTWPTSSTWHDLETLTYAAVPLLQMWPDPHERAGKLSSDLHRERADDYQLQQSKHRQKTHRIRLLFCYWTITIKSWNNEMTWPTSAKWLDLKHSAKHRKEHKIG